MLVSTVDLGDVFVELSVLSAMLGSTVALGDDFLELLVFSTMLGSTVALGDDFLELLVFSAMLGSTVALRDDFEEMVAFSALLGSTLDLWCCQSSWPLHRCSSRTRLFCLDPEVHHNGGARNCSSSSRSSTSLSVRRDSFPWSHFRDH